MLSISRLTSSDPIILKIEGRIDGLTSKQIQTEIDDILNSGVKNLIFDLADLNYLSSSGIRVFIEAMKKINKVGGQLYLVSLSRHIVEVLKISGLTPLFKVFDSFQDIQDMLNQSNSKTVF